MVLDAWQLLAYAIIWSKGSHLVDISWSKDRIAEKLTASDHCWLYVNVILRYALSLTNEFKEINAYSLFTLVSVLRICELNSFYYYSIVFSPFHWSLWILFKHGKSLFASFILFDTWVDSSAVAFNSKKRLLNKNVFVKWHFWLNWNRPTVFSAESETPSEKGYPRKLDLVLEIWGE